MKLPPDQTEREAFANELETNFSVIAAAGSGKTRAITDRIVRIAGSKRATELLPKLVVVTYTNRAADEMQQRARERTAAGQERNAESRGHARLTSNRTTKQRAYHAREPPIHRVFDHFRPDPG